MNRTVKDRRVSHPKPVEKAELSEKHLGWRIFFFILFVIIAATSFAYGVNSMFSTDPGWYEVEADSAAETNCGSEFVFMYHLGVSGTDATTENKALKIVYTDACEMAYKLFHNNETFEEVNNICYINQHPNEEIVVDEALYEAFSMVAEYDSRYIYLAPIYWQYDEIFFCEDDSQLVYYDPYLNEEVAAEYQKIAAYAKNPEMVEVQLLGNNTIKLYVAEEYLAFAEENCITEFIDFFWMKNAFIVDYLADTLIEKGYTVGTISSYDGFSRSLYQGEETFSFNVYDREGQVIYPAAVMNYSSTRSIVYLRDYMMNALDTQHYYALKNGETRTSYVDVADGFSKTATDNLYAYSDELSCAEILMQVAPIYVADEFAEEAVNALVDKGIYSIYCEGNVIKYNEKALVLSDLLDKEGVKYTAEFVK